MPLFPHYAATPGNSQPIAKALRHVLLLGAVMSWLPMPAPAAELLIADDFESGDIGKWKSSDTITTEVVHAGKYALKYVGWPGTRTDFAASDEIYMKWYWYFPEGFNWNEEGVGGRHFWRLADTNELHEQVDVGAGGKGQIGMSIISLGNDTELDVGATDADLPEGRWFSFEFYYKRNTSTTDLGMWIDGKRVHTWSVDFGAYSDDGLGIPMHLKNPIGRLALTTNYGSPGSDSDLCTSRPGKCYWFIDDVEVWNGCPPGAPCAELRSGDAGTPAP